MKRTPPRQVKIGVEDVIVGDSIVLGSGQEIIGVSDVKEYGDSEQFYVTVVTAQYID